MGKMQRNKGKAFERHVVARFRAVYGASVKRGIGQARAGGEVPDVDGVPGLWLECKHHRNVSVRAALVQGTEAERASRLLCLSPDGICRSPRKKAKACLGCENAAIHHAKIRTPIAVCRDNGKPELVAMWLDDFLALMTEVEHLRRERSIPPGAKLVLGEGEAQ